MDGGGPDLQVARPDGLGVRISQSSLVVGHVDGSGEARLEHKRGNNAGGDRRDSTGSELWTYRSGLWLLVGYGPRAHPITAWSKHGTMITWANLWQATKQPLLS